MKTRALPIALSLLAACSGGSGTAYQRGVAAYESGDIRTARVEFLNALQKDPNDRAARVISLGSVTALRKISEIGNGRPT